MGCNCGKSKAIAHSQAPVLMPKAGSRPASVNSAWKFCPACKTYKTPRSRIVVRCPICQTVFSAA